MNVKKVNYECLCCSEIYTDNTNLNICNNKHIWCNNCITAYKIALGNRNIKLECVHCNPCREIKKSNQSHNQQREERRIPPIRNASIILQIDQSNRNQSNRNQSNRNQSNRNQSYINQQLIHRSNIICGIINIILYILLFVSISFISVYPTHSFIYIYYKNNEINLSEYDNYYSFFGYSFILFILIYTYVLFQVIYKLN